MHFSVLVIADGDVTRATAEEVVEPLLAPHREEYDEAKNELIGEWDWWVVGGRWTGTLGDYNPREDSQNWTTCDLCAGTGRRPDAESFGAEWIEWSGGCNGCQGSGTRPVWPTERVPYEGDVKPARDLNGGDWPKCIHSVVTPDGAWHGSWRSDVDLDDARKRELVSAHPEATVVVVDCHR